MYDPVATSRSRSCRMRMMWSNDGRSSRCALVHAFTVSVYVIGTLPGRSGNIGSSTCTERVRAEPDVESSLPPATESPGLHVHLDVVRVVLGLARDRAEWEVSV